MASARKSEVARLRSATYSPEASSACVSSIDFGREVGIKRFIFRHLPKRYQPVSFANLDSFTSVRFRRRLAAGGGLACSLRRTTSTNAKGASRQSADRARYEV